jgi:hypothetical protein
VSALAEALAAAQAELPLAVGRDSQGNGYRYTSLDKLIAETRPILSRHGISITQEPGFVQVGDGLRPILTTRMECGDDRSGFSTPLYVTDKSMQALGTAITYARRYAWAAALGIASEEDTDGALYTDQEDVPF